MALRFFGAVAFVLVLSACRHDFPYRGVESGESFTPAELEWCRKLDGEIQQVGFDSQTCVYPAPDAGKACRDTRDCQGRCVAPDDAAGGEETQGKCSTQVGRAGCANLVVDGRATGRFCTD